MTNIKPIRIGIIGLASIARNHIIPTLFSLKNHYEVKAIASKKNKKYLDFYKNYNTKFYENYEDLIYDKNIDAVYIPLPNSLHYKWAKKSLDQGLNVLVEKPLTCSFNQTQELVEIAKSKNLALVENFQFRFHNQLKFIKKLIGNGDLGDIRTINSSFGFPPLNINGLNNIRYSKSLGGGALLDAGVYPCKISQILLGFDLEIKTATLVKPDNFEVDIWGGAYLEDKTKGISSHLSFGFDNFYKCSLDIWGSRGRLSTYRIFTAKPGFEPEIHLENKDGLKTYKLNSDNHFRNILLHFHKLCFSKKGLKNEYIQNIDQARMISSISSNANLH